MNVCNDHTTAPSTEHFTQRSLTLWRPGACFIKQVYQISQVYFSLTYCLLIWFKISQTNWNKPGLIMNQCDQNVAERPVKHSLLYAFCHLIDLIVYTFYHVKALLKGPFIQKLKLSHLLICHLFFSSIEHERRYFGSQSVDGSHWLQYYWKKIVWKSMGTGNCDRRKEANAPNACFCSVNRLQGKIKYYKSVESGTHHSLTVSNVKVC